MTVFYRYVRPVKFNQSRAELQTHPLGGICLRFETNPDNTLWFSYARCYADELFSKSVAKRIADERALYIDPIAKSAMNIANPTSVGLQVGSVIDWCLTWNPIPYPPVVVYAQEEFRALGRALDEICLSNDREMEKEADWVTIHEAAGYYLRYEKEFE